VQVRNAPTNANNVVTYDCVISVTNSDYKLKPGMTANISFIIAQRENVLTIPNAALRFHPLDSALAGTNSAAPPRATNNGNFAGTAGGPGHRSGRAHGERPVFHTVYVLSGTGNNAKLQAAQIKTGISDGISTEVLSGLDEGAKIVTGVVLTGTQAAKAPTPPAGGFPRMR
jgi:HlyD family secretion protein